MTIIEQNFEARQVVLDEYGEDGAAPVPRQPKAAPPRVLLEPHELAEIGPPEAVRLPLDLVDANALNPRRQLVEVDALADNIKRFGLLQPVTVRRMGERYELLGGHRRRAAFLLLREREPIEPQWRTIPAVVRTADDDESYLMLLSSQLHSKSWAPREEAAGLERLAETRTLREVGSLVNRSEGWVSKRLRVYADAVLSGYVQSGQLSTMVAEELLLLPDAAMKQEYADRAVDEGWTALAARREVNKLKVSKQLTQVARQAREMLTLLSAIDPTQFPKSSADDLVNLARRIMFLATGQEVVFPSIDEARKVAGVNPDKPATRPRARRKA